MSNPDDYKRELAKRIETIKLAASDQEASLNKLKQDYLKNKQIGIYNYITEIPNLSVFYYFYIFLFIFYSLNLIDFSLKNIIVLFGTTLCIYFINEKRRSTTLTRMEELELKMNSIFPKPKFFYYDSGIIELIFSIREYKIYNVISFNKLIRTLDDFLSIMSDIDKNPKMAYKMYDTLKMMKNASLNLLHSIIYNIPSNIIAENKLNDAMDSLQFILQIHLEKVKNISNEIYKKDGPNVNNNYISYDHIEKDDPYVNYHYDRY